MQSLRRFVTLLVLLALLTAGQTSARAQTIESKYFSETGHNVAGEFLAFYNGNPNAVFLYGYPITEEFNGKDGKRVQYFQRARFEYVNQRVQLTPLGRLTFVSTGKVNVENNFACRTYAETGFSVCFEFLAFFEAYGGVAQFGFPISGFESHDNKLVQYFEKARLEWQPWRPEGQRVVVSELGSAYFKKLGEDIGLLPPVKPLDGTIQAVLSIRVRAFTWKAVTNPADNQAIFVVVQDQNLQPVDRASCTAVVHWPDGHADSYPLTTNATGVAIITFNFAQQSYGSLVYADVACAYNSLNGNTTTSFRIWY